MSTILNAYNLNGGDTTSSVFTYAGATRNLDIEIITDSIGGLSAYVIIETSSDESNWILVPNSQIQINRGSDSYVYHITESEGAYVRVRLFRMDSHSGTMTITANEAAVTGLLEAANNLSDVADATTSRNNLGAEAVANKATDFTVINDTLYPSVKAVDTQITTALATTVTELEAQTTAIGDTLIAGTDTIGLYLIEYYLVVTAADVLSVGSVDFRLNWIDLGGTTFQRGAPIPFNVIGRTNEFATTNQKGNLIYVGNDNGILFSTVFTGGVILTAAYSLFIVSRKIA